MNRFWDLEITDERTNEREWIRRSQFRSAADEKHDRPLDCKNSRSESRVFTVVDNLHIRFVKYYKCLRNVLETNDPMCLLNDGIENCEHFLLDWGCDCDCGIKFINVSGIYKEPRVWAYNVILCQVQLGTLLMSLVGRPSRILAVLYIIVWKWHSISPF